MSEPLDNRPLREWPWVAGLAAVALALRLGYVWQLRRFALINPDELDPAFYFSWAKEIAAGAWLGKAPFVQSPLYAYLLGFLIRLIGSRVTGILVVQSLAGCGTVLLTWYAGRRLLGPLQGLIAGLIVALYGPFIFYEGMVMKTFLSPFLTVLLLVLLDHAGSLGRQPEAGRADRAFALAGMVYGLTALDRDNFILLAPALAVLALFLGGGWGRRGIRAAGAFTLGTILLVAPVTLRNWMVSRDFVLLTTGGGEVFFIGNNADANGLYVPPPFVRPDPKYEHADFIARASEITGRNLTPMQSSWFWFREGVRFITDEPLAWCRLLARKFLHFWNYYELPDNLDYEIVQQFSPLLAALNQPIPPRGWPTLMVPWSDRFIPVRLHLFLTFGTLAPLGLAGLLLARRDWRRLLPLHVLLFGYMATVLLFFNFSRFRVPVVPLLALPASVTILWIGRYARRAWDLAVAFAARAGDMAGRVRALRPGRPGLVICCVLAIGTVGVNLELPRGVLPSIEQSLILGNAYYADREPDKALQSYTTGLILLGEGPQGREGEMLLSRFGFGLTREALKREVDAEAVARGPQFKGIHLGIHHGLGIAWLQKAQALLEAGSRQEAMRMIDLAIAQLDESLKIAPAYLLSLRKIGLAYGLKGDNAQAIEWLSKATDLWPDDYRARLDLAEALFNGGEFKRALRELDEVRKVNKSLDRKELAEIYLNRGLVLERGTNEPERALASFEKVLELDPQHPQAAEVRKAIEELRARGYAPKVDEPDSSPSGR
jgi:tetratricopeptide (TPR) repeat protein/4-amino-4-deoxy-L-arabinose transferase-like glycosyltransferase